MAVNLLDHQSFVEQIRSNGTGGFEHPPEEIGGHQHETTPSLLSMEITGHC
jgi:hypothetical protein